MGSVGLPPILLPELLAALRLHAAASSRDANHVGSCDPLASLKRWRSRELDVPL